MPFTPAHQNLQAPQLTCAECGTAFVPRRVGDGVEELCDACYQDRFAPLAARHARLEKKVA